MRPARCRHGRRGGRYGRRRVGVASWRIMSPDTPRAVSEQWRKRDRPRTCTHCAPVVRIGYGWRACAVSIGCLPLSRCAVAAASMPHLARPPIPQPYDVTLAPTGNAALDQALHDSSTLVSLQKTAPVGAFAPDGAGPPGPRHGCHTRAAQLRLLQGAGHADDRRPAAGRSRPARTIDHAPAKPPVPVTCDFELGPAIPPGQGRHPGRGAAGRRAPSWGCTPAQPARGGGCAGGAGPHC